MQMVFRTVFVLSALVATLASVAFADEIPAFVVEVAPFNRSSFPKGFTFGSASSAYQYEGAANTDGRGPSIWDTFSHLPNRTTDGGNGDVAIDQYHRYKEDVGIMRYMNLDAYRFSISWPRILPTGRPGKDKKDVNQKGVEYYHKLIDELKANGIEPFVTLFHWDLPQPLEDEYGGFLNKTFIVEDFKNYADLCFELFGKKVKHWITINEPSIFTSMGYALGTFAPGRCTNSSFTPNCLGGNSSTEPYIVAHNMLLSHAAAVKVYKDKHNTDRQGKIGITLSQGWVIPYTNTTLDQEAAQRSLQFSFGWFMDPITKGEYPQIMRDLVQSRLPTFTPSESILLRNSFDFLGLNYYTSNYGANSDTPGGSYLTDSRVTLTSQRNGLALGPRAGSGNGWIYIYPQGLQDILLYIKDKYGNPLVYITENGMDEFNDESLTVDEAVIDTYRIDYHYRHLFYLNSAIKNGANVSGYFAWSLLDNFEWASGYTSRFGINYVDYKDHLKRYHKLSATWFKNFLRRT